MKQAIVLFANENILAFIICNEKLNKTSEKHVISALREYIAARIPEYMLPNKIVLLEQLPLTISGKIDEAALLASVDNLNINSSYEVPRNIIEYKLINVWKKILKIEKIGVHDNFFELGGHSLLIVQLISAISDIFNEPLSVIDLFKYPTIAQLATLFERKETTQPILPIQIKGDKTPIFFIPPATGLPFVYLPMENYLESQPIYALTNPKFYSTHDKFETIESMAFYYAEVIKQYGSFDSYIFGGFSFGGLVAYEVAHQLQRANKIVELIILIDTYNFSQIDYKAATLEEHDQHLIALNIDPSSPSADWARSEIIHNEKLASEYKPQIYFGNVLLIKAENSLAEFSWENISTRIS